MATVACVAWRFKQFFKQLLLRRFLSALKLLKNHQATQAMARGTGKIQIRQCDWLPEEANQYQSILYLTTLHLGAKSAR